jgi:N-methylhydantoinase A/oxoprolinase/acetone carboxylase beta subunit
VYFESSSGGNSDNLNSAEKTEKVQKGRIDTPVYKLEALEIGEELVGPAMVIDETQTIVLVPGAKAVVTRNHLVIEL